MAIEEGQVSDDERFVCPRCGMASANPTDLAEGYCGACHDFTGERPTGRLTGVTGVTGAEVAAHRQRLRDRWRYATKTGRVLSDAGIQAWPTRAEAGYDVDRLWPRTRTEEGSDHPGDRSHDK